MVVDEGETLGPWENSNLPGTVKANAGIGADASVPASVRFRSNVVKLMRRRLAVDPKPEELNLPAIFLLQPSPPESSRSTSPKRVPMLDNGRHMLNGKIWFVGAGPGSGHFVPFEFDDDDCLFRFVTDELELGCVPAIIFDPRVSDPLLRHYLNGLNDPNTFEEILLGSADVSLDRVCEIIDLTYQDKMKTPNAQPRSGKLWKNSSKGIPSKDAEEKAQMYLEIALNTAFPTCTIRTEQSMTEGRSDIEILENDPNERSKITQHAVLELKIVRSFWASGLAVSETRSKELIESGVIQAAAYRDSKGAKWGVLVCFDMRSKDIGDKACFKHVVKTANKRKVHLRRWFVYASSAQFRADMAARQN